MRLTSFLSLTCGLCLLASCYEKDIEGPEPVSTFSISTTPAAMTLKPDSVTSFTVAVRNETRGQAVSAIGSFAESDAPSIVRVETTSRPDSFKVTAVDGGTARIIVGYTGSTGSARDTIVVTATPRPVATVRLTPDSTGVFVGATTTLRAALLDAAGDTIRQRTATIALANPGDTTIATVVSATGVVTGVRVGTVSIIASRKKGGHVESHGHASAGEHRDRHARGYDGASGTRCSSRRRFARRITCGHRSSDQLGELGHDDARVNGTGLVPRRGAQRPVPNDHGHV